VDKVPGRELRFGLWIVLRVGFVGVTPLMPVPKDDSVQPLLQPAADRGYAKADRDCAAYVCQQRVLGAGRRDALQAFGEEILDGTVTASDTG